MKRVTSLIMAAMLTFTMTPTMTAYAETTKSITNGTQSITNETSIANEKSMTSEKNSISSEELLEQKAEYSGISVEELKREMSGEETTLEECGLSYKPEKTTEGMTKEQVMATGDNEKTDVFLSKDGQYAFLIYKERKNVYETFNNDYANKAEIEAYYGNAIDYTTPTEIDGFPVSRINVGSFYQTESYTGKVLANGDSIKTVTITSNIKYVSGSCFNYLTNLESITVEAGNTHYVSCDGVLYETYDEGYNYWICAYPLAREGEVFTIPPFCSVFANAFNTSNDRYYKHLKTVIIPKTIKSYLCTCVLYEHPLNIIYCARSAGTDVSQIFKNLPQGKIYVKNMKMAKFVFSHMLMASADTYNGGNYNHHNISCCNSAEIIIDDGSGKQQVYMWGEDGDMHLVKETEEPTVMRHAEYGSGLYVEYIKTDKGWQMNRTLTAKQAAVEWDGDFKKMITEKDKSTCLFNCSKIPSETEKQYIRYYTMTRDDEDYVTDTYEDLPEDVVYGYGGASTKEPSISVGTYNYMDGELIHLNSLTDKKVRLLAGGSDKDGGHCYANTLCSEYKFSVSDTNVAEIQQDKRQEATLTFKKPGTVTVTVTATFADTETLTASTTLTAVEGWDPEDRKDIGYGFTVRKAKTDYTGKEIDLKSLIDSIQRSFVYKEVTYGKDYTIETEQPVKDAGTYTVTVKGLGIYEGSSCPITVTVNPVDVGSATIVSDKTSYDVSLEEALSGKLDLTEDKFAGYTVKVQGQTLDTDSYKIKYIVEENAIRQVANITKNYEMCNGVKLYTLNKKTVDFTLDAASFDYTGKEIRPNVTATVEGQVLNPAAYTVTYENNTEPGTATAKITLNDGYKSVLTSDNMELSYQIKKKPDTRRIVKPVAKIKAVGIKKKAITLKLSCNVKGAKYRIQYTTDKKFKKAVHSKTTTKNVITLKNLRKGNYYVRVSATAKTNGKTITGKWSNIKRVSVKK